MKKLLIALLILSTLFCASCGNSGEPSQTTATPSTQATVKYPDNLPPTDAYDGTEFRVLAGNPTKEENFLMSEPEGATNLQSQSYKCAAMLEERYGITMKYTFMDSYSEGHKAFLAEITETTLGGAQTAYDLVVPGYWYGLTIAKGYYTNLNTLSHLDFSNPWWNQSFNENVTINGIMYACVSDFAIDSILGAYGVVFNQKIVEAHDMISPFIYYDNNLWTQETMLAMTKEAYNGSVEGNETYGILLSRQPVDAFYIASDLHFVEAEDGNVRLTKYSAQAEDLYQKLFRLINSDECKFSTVSNKAELTDLFMRDKALFGCFCLDEIRAFRSMESNYGVIVYPKYDQNQEKYVSGSTGGGIFAIPSKARDAEMSALVLEAMSAAFYTYVRPALIEVTLEGQSVRDPISAEMVTEIINSIYWDFGFINHTSIGNVANFAIRMEDGYDVMSGWYGSEMTSYKRKLIEFMNSFLTGE